MDYETLILERQGTIALLRLNRPERHNAINRRMALELTKALDALEGDDSVVVVVLTGNGGRAFSAGADMAEILADPTAQGVAGQVAAHLLRFPKPVIAAINGYAFGGGAILAINCDIRVASTEASFRFPGASYGLVVGASQLPRIVGLAAAKELIFTARVVGAEEALRIGLVNRLVPPEELEAETLAMARQIAAQSLPALIASKEVMELALQNQAAVAREGEINRALRRSQEHQERFGQAARRITGQSS